MAKLFPFLVLRMLSHAGDTSEENNISGYTRSEVSSNLPSVIEFLSTPAKQRMCSAAQCVSRLKEIRIRGYDFYKNG